MAHAGFNTLHHHFPKHFTNITSEDCLEGTELQERDKPGLANP